MASKKTSVPAAPVHKEHKTNLPSTNVFHDDAGAGFEGVNSEMYAKPMLQILQALSPQLTTGHALYNKAARQGEIVHSVTQELFPSVAVIPCAVTQTYLEWVPRTAGGGFRGEHAYTEGRALHEKYLDRKTNVCALPQGTELVPTLNYFVLLLRSEDAQPERVVISMAKTQIRSAKMWNSMMAAYRPDGWRAINPPPFYASVYQLSSAPKKNDKGTWFVWQVSRVGEMDKAAPYVETARSFRQQVNSGLVNVDRSTFDTDLQTGDGEASGDTL